MTFLMSSETLPSSAWRNSTAESSERISVGIFTSMPLAVWMGGGPHPPDGAAALHPADAGGGDSDGLLGLRRLEDVAFLHIVVEGDSR